MLWRKNGFVAYKQYTHSCYSYGYDFLDIPSTVLGGLFSFIAGCAAAGR